ncbi:MAG: hypothetical protein LC799_23525 [Actinobacteria bacterium]|nr:hypothetical protein [Actinomycetota bacterium]
MGPEMDGLGANERDGVAMCLEGAERIEEHSTSDDRDLLVGDAVGKA